MSQYWPQSLTADGAVSDRTVSGRNVSERKVAPPSVAVSTVIFALGARASEFSSDNGQQHPHSLIVPLVRRTREPYKGCWALPGGPLAWNESLADAAVRTLSETTRQRPKYFEQLYAFGGLDRSPDKRLVSVVYWAMVTLDRAPNAVGIGNVTDADNVEWFDVHHLPALAFDHARIVSYALERLKAKAEYSVIVHALLGPTFTLAELRGVYEAVLNKALDPANFRRTMLGSGQLEPTGEVTAGRHRPAKRYQFIPSSTRRPEVMLAEPELSTLTSKAETSPAPASPAQTQATKDNTP